MKNKTDSTSANRRACLEAFEVEKLRQIQVGYIPPQAVDKVVLTRIEKHTEVGYLLEKR